MTLKTAQLISHAYLGTCIYLQESILDSNSIFVKHEGEIKKVSKNLILELLLENPPLIKNFEEWDKNIRLCNQKIIKEYQAYKSY
jgi:hypothetical protein